MDLPEDLGDESNTNDKDQTPKNDQKIKFREGEDNNQYMLHTNNTGNLKVNDYITIIITATLASIGTAGIPSAGILMLSIILREIGIPLEGITLLLGVDRLLDMIRTSVNVTGDTCITCIVAKSEKMLDEKKYNADEN